MAFDFDSINNDINIADSIDLFKAAVLELNECINDINQDNPEYKYPLLKIYKDTDDVDYIDLKGTGAVFYNFDDFKKWYPYFLKHKTLLPCLIRKGLPLTKRNEYFNVINPIVRLSSCHNESDFLTFDTTKHIFKNPYDKRQGNNIFEYDNITFNYTNLYDFIIIYAILVMHLAHEQSNYSFTLNEASKPFYNINNSIKETIAFLKLVTAGNYGVQYIMSRWNAPDLINNIIINLSINNKLTDNVADNLIKAVECKSLDISANLILKALGEISDNTADS